jgi:hypothetical protein
MLNYRNEETDMTLQELEALEKKVTKTQQTQTAALNNETLEVSPIVKSRHRRYSYKLGQRYLARDQVERELSTESYALAG